MYLKQLYSIFILTVMSTLLISCSHKKDLEYQSFYHWKLDPEWSEKDNELIDRIRPRRVYLHIMDVQWKRSQAKAVPSGILNIDPSSSCFSYEVVPVIFITAEVFKHIDVTKVNGLSANTIKALASFLKKYPRATFQEVQIDCDWTKASQKKYFAYLTHLKEQLKDKKVSSTLRLYPYKYKKNMGVPPVDYCVLMCYNMDNIKSERTRNSIIDTNVLKAYLTQNDYPKRLIPALPLFGWSVWFRNSRYMGLISGEKSMYLDASTFKKEGYGLRVLKDTLIANKLLRAGDMIRNEYVDKQTLESSILLLQSKINPFNEIIYYHWDQELIEAHSDLLIIEKK